MHGVVNGVLDRALLGREAVAQGLELLVVRRGGELGLDARLQPSFRLGHELRAVNIIHRTVRCMAECKVRVQAFYRTSCHEAKSAGAMDTATLERSRTLICEWTSVHVSRLTFGEW